MGSARGCRRPDDPYPIRLSGTAPRRPGGNPARALRPTPTRHRSGHPGLDVEKPVAGDPDTEARGATRRRPVVHVGRAAGGHDSGPGRRRGHEGGEHDAARRCPGDRGVLPDPPPAGTAGAPARLHPRCRPTPPEGAARPSRRGPRVVEAPGTRTTRSGADGCGTAPRPRLGEHHRLRTRGTGPGLGGLRRRRCRCRRARELGIN